MADPIDTRPCRSCAAPLAAGQDWCLECGTAQPGRLGARPGWRAALTVAGACGLLATGAGAAAYAALSSEAQRVAAAPAPPAAAPTIAQAPAATTPPATTTPTVPAPASEPADVPTVRTPKPADEPAPAPAPAPAPSPSASSGTTAGGDGDTASGAAEPVAIDLPGKAASTYDPYSRAGTAAGDPADAVDGEASTAWEVPVGPDGEVRIGLALSLEEARTLSRLELTADTPGFTVEVYGSRSSTLPPDILDARWENLGSRKDVGLGEEIDLKGKYRHVLLWVTAQPADTKVAIPEIQLFD